MGIGPMKYMGSKRVMLSNGLGELLDKEVPKAKRFVDMFLGTAEVASFVAQRHVIPVYGVDLQAYSVVLAEAVIARCSVIPWHNVWKNWSARARRVVVQFRSPKLSDEKRLTQGLVHECRIWCATKSDELPITCAYGGHYFSPSQAV